MTEEKTLKKGQTLAIIVVTICFIGIITILGKGLYLNPKSSPNVLIGKQASDFALPSLEDPSKILSLKDFQGSPLILNFWASWCTSCKEEAQEMERYWQKVKGDGVKVLGIAIQDEHDLALDFAKTYGKTYTLLLDQDGKVAIDYGVVGVPETFFIDKNGLIKAKYSGPMDLKLLEEYFQKGALNI